MSSWTSFKGRFSTKKSDGETGSGSGETEKATEASGGDSTRSSKAMEAAHAFSARVGARARATSNEVAKKAAIASGRAVNPKAPCRVGFIGMARDRKLLVWARDGGEIGPTTAVLSERYAALGRRMAGRSDPPGWDDISDSSSKDNASMRCIKLPVCDLDGTSSYIVAFGTGYPLAKAQSLCERLALLLGPLVDAALASKDASKAKGVSPESAVQLREVLEREIASANDRAKVQQVENQVAEVRSIMERNVEMILDRGEKLESLENKSDELNSATGMFRKQARKLKRWHLMNQVKWGVAVGTLVTASVAVPIAILAVA